MGFMNWVSDLLGSNANRGAKAVSQPPTAAELDEIEGLNFRKAVDAHQVWKNRIRDYITGQSREVLDPTLIAKPEECILGKWMLQVGNTRYGKETMYLNLQAVHLQFHYNASLVVSMARSGRRQAALQMLEKGDYPNTAIKLVSLLARLYHRCQDGSI